VGVNVGISFITPELPEGCAENKQILLLGSVLPVRYKLHHPVPDRTAILLCVVTCRLTNMQ
jgi:hypothetical protein